MGERLPQIAPSGFREYDARWRYPEEISLAGLKRLGLAFGHFARETRGAKKPAIVCGRDYRSYSEEVQSAFVSGLVEAGCLVRDIGLALSPTAYFAHSDLKADGVAMITASHNPNGWTGVKMGLRAPLTLMPDEIARVKDLTFSESLAPAEEAGSVAPHEEMRGRYIESFGSHGVLPKPLRIVLDCGNGTAGFFAPEIFRRLGAEIVELNCDPDFSFPHYNPNPEDMAMMRSLGGAVRDAGADLGLAFDGDGDRCGFTDEKGEIISADKAGLLIARDMARRGEGKRFIADVKSTGLYGSVLGGLGAEVEYWKTGHSYMKRRLWETGSAAAFEKSGHFFFGGSMGGGYDDGILSGVVMAALLCRSGLVMSALALDLPRTWISPTLSPFCGDGEKYRVVEGVLAFYRGCGEVCGRRVVGLVDVNGVRVILEDGSWLLVRASSNVPGLVVVVESFESEGDMEVLIDEVRSVLGNYSEVGTF